MNSTQGLPALPSGWEARLGLNGRVYYYSFHSQTLQILPPPELWRCVFDLPYGWELASDYEENFYFINHMLQTVTYEDPREQDSNDENKPTLASNHQPRQCIITRDDNLGFGFIAGSEKPVIIRSVTPGGPSDNKLLPGDFIIKIGNENVKNANRERVIELIRGCEDSVTLTVLQPSRTASSSFLKPEKKLIKGMNRPRVRFADDSAVNGENKISGSSRLLVVPGVLRVILEEGQTRSFQFNRETTAGDVVTTLCEKLEIVDSQLYALVLAAPENQKNLTRNHDDEITHFNEILVAPWDSIEKVVSNPSLKYHDCHFRLVFVAKDIHKLSRDDPKSFQYLYVQCVNDVVSGKVYKNDLSTDELLKLASLQIIELNVSQNSDFDRKSLTQAKNSGRRLSFQSSSKISVKQMEKEYGLSRFLPPEILADVNSNQSKEMRKTLQNYIKTNYHNYVIMGGSGVDQKGFISPAPPNNMPMSIESVLTKIRMQYLKTLSHLHPYGGSYFEATILDVMESDITLLVGHHYGISQLIKSKTKMASLFADFPLVEAVEIAPCPPEARKTNVRVDFKDMAPLVLSMHPLSALNFAFMISGYCRVHENNDMMLTLPLSGSEIAPDYFGTHKVRTSNWNYPPDDSKDPTDLSNFHYSDFSEPIDITLLSNQIPASVRAMFQQNRDPDAKPKKEIEAPSSSQQRPTTEDEGVAMVTNDLSPMSSVSSVTSLSPSSGIGSVTSQREHVVEGHVTNGAKSDDDAEWNELMVALEVDEEISSLSSNKIDQNSENPEEKCANTDQNVDIEQPESSLDGSDNSDTLLVVSVNEQENCEENVNQNEVQENAVKNDNVENDENSTQLDGELDSDDAAVPKQDKENEQNAHYDGVPMENHYDQVPKELNDKVTMRNKVAKGDSGKRLSSFQSMGGNDPNPVEVSAVDESHSPITSEELEANLNGSSVTPVVLQGQEEEEIPSSPFPVADLAQSQKKQTKRRFWFRSNRLSRSISLDKGLARRTESSNNKKSFFRRLFSPKRSYSLKKGQESSTFSLTGDQTPSDGGTGRITIKSADRSTSRFRFSFFKGWGRKKLSRTVVFDHDEQSPPASGDVMSSGVYSVFDSPPGKVAVDESEKSGNVRRTTSMENVQLRLHDKSPPAQRPVSFMTFQRSSTLPSKDMTTLLENTPSTSKEVTSSTNATLETDSKKSEDVDDTTETKTQSDEKIESKSVPPNKPRRLTMENKLKENASNEDLSEAPASPPKATKRKAPPPPPASKIPADEDEDEEDRDCDKVTEFNSVADNDTADSNSNEDHMSNHSSVSSDNQDAIFDIDVATTDVVSRDKSDVNNCIEKITAIEENENIQASEHQSMDSSSEISDENDFSDVINSHYETDIFKATKTSEVSDSSDVIEKIDQGDINEQGAFPIQDCKIHEQSRDLTQHQPEINEQDQNKELESADHNETGENGNIFESHNDSTAFGISTYSEQPHDLQDDNSDAESALKETFTNDVTEYNANVVNESNTQHILNNTKKSDLTSEKYEPTVIIKPPAPFDSSTPSLSSEKSDSQIGDVILNGNNHEQAHGVEVEANKPCDHITILALQLDTDDTNSRSQVVLEPEIETKQVVADVTAKDSTPLNSSSVTTDQNQIDELPEVIAARSPRSEILSVVTTETQPNLPMTSSFPGSLPSNNDVTIVTDVTSIPPPTGFDSHLLIQQSATKSDQNKSNLNSNLTNAYPARLSTQSDKENSPMSNVETTKPTEKVADLPYKGNSYMPTSGYSSLITPRLFGQKNEYKAYARIKAPVAKQKPNQQTIKPDYVSPFNQNGETEPPAFIAKRVVKSVRPPIAPKPNFLQ